jgi:hypothetical protein
VPRKIQQGDLLASSRRLIARHLERRSAARIARRQATGR